MLRTIRTLLRTSLAYIALFTMLILASAAVPAGAAAEADDDGAYGPEDMCNLSADSKDFSAISSTPKLPPTKADPAPREPIVYTLCPPDAYYLTYVDGRGVLGTLSEAVTQEGTGVLETAQKTGINSAASSVFVLHAKLVSLTINVMNWAFAFDAVAVFEEPVKTLTSILGERVYHVALPVIYVMAVGYAAWVSIGRGEVANGLTALLKSAVVGTMGAMIIANPLGTTKFYNDTINNLTNQVFEMVDEVAKTPDSDSPLFPQVEDTGPHMQDPLSNISRSMWLTYVQMPWARLQISNDNHGADEEGRGGIADEYAPDVLRIRHPDDRAAYLCDLSGSDCDGWFGGGAGGGEEPEEPTGGETTGGEETTNE